MFPVMYGVYDGIGVQYTAYRHRESNAASSMIDARRVRESIHLYI